MPHTSAIPQAGSGESWVQSTSHICNDYRNGYLRALWRCKLVHPDVSSACAADCHNYQGSEQLTRVRTIAKGQSILHVSGQWADLASDPITHWWATQMIWSVHFEWENKDSPNHGGKKNWMKCGQHMKTNGIDVRDGWVTFHIYDFHMSSPSLSFNLFHMFELRSCAHTGPGPDAILGPWPPVLPTEIMQTAKTNCKTP